MAKIPSKQRKIPKIDPDFDRASEQEQITREMKAPVANEGTEKPPPEIFA